MKPCKNCGRFYKPSPKYKVHCSDTCRREYRSFQKAIYKKTKASLEKDAQRKKIVRKVLKKKANKKGEPYSKEDLDLVLKRENGKFLYTSAEVALIVGRSQTSIWQVRRRKR
jgi:sialic acid synthase SpsE